MRDVTKNESFAYVNDNTIALIKLYQNVNKSLATKILEHDLDADDDFYATMEDSARRFVDVFRDESCVAFLECIIKECMKEIRHHDKLRTTGSFIDDFMEELKCG